MMSLAVNIETSVIRVVTVAISLKSRVLLHL